MKTKLRNKPKSNNLKVSFNIPLQIMLSKKINNDLSKRLSELSKSKADYVRSLIVEDLSNSQKVS